MSDFYRFLHPLAFDRARNQVYTPDTGGICFSVKSDGKVDEMWKLRVACSVCPDKIKFDRSMARHIADAELASGSYHCIQTFTLATNIIAKALVAHLEKTPLTAKILEMLAQHKQAWELDFLARDTIKALHIEDGYARQSKSR